VVQVGAQHSTDFFHRVIVCLALDILDAENLPFGGQKIAPIANHGRLARFAVPKLTTRWRPCMFASEHFCRLVGAVQRASSMNAEVEIGIAP
jgi:hypothetical protein